MRRGCHRLLAPCGPTSTTVRRLGSAVQPTADQGFHRDRRIVKSPSMRLATSQLARRLCSTTEETPPTFRETTCSSICPGDSDSVIVRSGGAITGPPRLQGMYMRSFRIYMPPPPPIQEGPSLGRFPHAAIHPKGPSPDRLGCDPTCTRSSIYMLSGIYMPSLPLTAISHPRSTSGIALPLPDP